MVSLIITVLNEEKSISSLLKDLDQQSFPPTEVVIVDGGSRDATLRIIRRFESKHFPVRLIIAKGANRSQGRNIAVLNAHHEIIAVTDGGVRLHTDWLLNITRRLLEEPSIDVVTGMTHSMARTLVEKCFSAIIIHNQKEIESADFLEKFYYSFIYRRRFGKTLPSSRSLAFRKSIWNKVGGYPEDIPCSEDMVFNLALQKIGAKFHRADDAIVYWTPGNSIGKNLKYFWKNALWDGVAGIFFTRSLLKLSMYILGLFILILGLSWHWLFLVFFLLGAAVYSLQPTLVSFRITGNPSSVFITPFLLFGKDISQSLGFLFGLMFRRFPALRSRFA